MWNLGELQVTVRVSKGGELKFSVGILKDELELKFPLDTNKKLVLSDEEYKDYVDSVLDKRERWIRDNIPSGVYSCVMKLGEESFRKEKE